MYNFTILKNWISTINIKHISELTITILSLSIFETPRSGSNAMEYIFVIKQDEKNTCPLFRYTL